MFWYFTSATIIGLIIYMLGRWGLAISLFTAGLKFAAVALVVAAVIFAYRRYRYRK